MKQKMEVNVLNETIAFSKFTIPFIKILKRDFQKM